MAGLKRRAAVAAFGSTIRLIDGSMMGGSVDMSRYVKMFARHNGISRTVEEVRCDTGC